MREGRGHQADYAVVCSTTHDVGATHLDCAPTQAEPPSAICNHMARTNIENFKVALPGYLLLACMSLVGTNPADFRAAAFSSAIWGIAAVIAAHVDT